MNADVRIDSNDCKGLERLLRYCALPAFSVEKLRALSAFGNNANAMKLVYGVNKNSQASQAPLNLTATELLDKLAQLIPPPRRHRHHYHGVLSANSKHRSSVTQCANQEYKPTKISSLTEINSVDVNFKAKSEVLCQRKKEFRKLGKMNNEGL